MPLVMVFLSSGGREKYSFDSLWFWGHRPEEWAEGERIQGGVMEVHFLCKRRKSREPIKSEIWESLRGRKGEGGGGRPQGGQKEGKANLCMDGLPGGGKGKKR